jgi:PAS domain-containing protein
MKKRRASGKSPSPYPDLPKQGEEVLRESERFARSTLDALSAHIAILDETGLIIAVNRAWRDFAQANHPPLSNVCEGANYLAVCDAGRGPDAEQAARLALPSEFEGLRVSERAQEPSKIA